MVLLPNPRFMLGRLTTFTGPVVAPLGTMACKTVPAALIAVGPTATGPDAVLNTTSAPRPKLLPSNSINWPTFADGWAGLGGVPLVAVETTLASVGAATAATSALTSMR